MPPILQNINGSAFIRAFQSKDFTFEISVRERSSASNDFLERRPILFYLREIAFIPVVNELFRFWLLTTPHRVREAPLKFVIKVPFSVVVIPCVPVEVAWEETA